MQSSKVNLTELFELISKVFPEVYKDYENFLAMKTYADDSDTKKNYFYEYIGGLDKSKFKPETIGMYIHHVVDAPGVSIEMCRTYVKATNQLCGMNIFTWPEGHSYHNEVFILGELMTNFDVNTQMKSATVFPLNSMPLEKINDCFNHTPHKQVMFACIPNDWWNPDM